MKYEVEELEDDVIIYHSNKDKYMLLENSHLRKGVMRANKKGFGFVEILSSCPTNWKMTPEQAHQRVREEMIPVFPLGVFKDITLEAR